MLDIFFFPSLTGPVSESMVEDIYIFFFPVVLHGSLAILSFQYDINHFVGEILRRIKFNLWIMVIKENLL